MIEAHRIAGVCNPQTFELAFCDPMSASDMEWENWRKVVGRLLVFAYRGRSDTRHRIRASPRGVPSRVKAGDKKPRRGPEKSEAIAAIGRLLARTLPSARVSSDDSGAAATSLDPQAKRQASTTSTMTNFNSRKCHGCEMHTHHLGLHLMQISSK